MTTGQRIKNRRKNIGFSAEKLAELLGVSPATIYRYESGDIEKVPGDRLGAIAKALQTTPAFLMGWGDDVASNNVNTVSLPYDDGVFPQLLKTYQELNADGRQKVYERATELAELPKYQLTPATDEAQHSAHSSEAVIQKYREQGYPVSDGLYSESATNARVASPITLPSSDEDDNSKK